jgi:hypothetical protein
MFVKQLIITTKNNKMKTLILSAITLLTITFNATASPEPSVNEKAQATFVTIFKGAVNITWSATANSTEAFFINNDTRTRATFDAKGNLIQTIRYYQSDKLSPVVLAEVTSAFPGKEIHGITEVSNKNGINYRIVLKDNKYYTHINANSTGDAEVVSKYKRGDK